MVTRNVKRTYDFLEGLYDRDRESVGFTFLYPDLRRQCSVHTHETNKISPYLKISWLGFRTTMFRGQISIFVIRVC